MWIRIAERIEFEFIDKPLVHYSRPSISSLSANSRSKISGIKSATQEIQAASLPRTERAKVSLSSSRRQLLLYPEISRKGAGHSLEAIRYNPFELRNYYNLLLSFLGADYFKTSQGSQGTKLDVKLAIPLARQRFRRRPRLLFLARPFPPRQAIGSVRAWNIAKYLTRMGWDVTVVTPHPTLWRGMTDTEEIERSLKGKGYVVSLTGHQWRHLCAHELKCWNSGLRVGIRRYIAEDSPISQY